MYVWICSVFFILLISLCYFIAYSDYYWAIFSCCDYFLFLNCIAMFVPGIIGAKLQNVCFCGVLLNDRYELHIVAMRGYSWLISHHQIIQTFQKMFLLHKMGENTKTKWLGCVPIFNNNNRIYIGHFPTQRWALCALQDTWRKLLFIQASMKFYQVLRFVMNHIHLIENNFAFEINKIKLLPENETFSSHELIRHHLHLNTLCLLFQNLRMH